MPKGKKATEEAKETKTQRRRRSISNSKYEPPKRPKTSYILFSIEKRPEFTEENPDIKGKDMMRFIGQQWNSLSDAEKRPYIEMGEREKELYSHQMEEYEELGYYHDERGNPVKNLKSSGASARRSSATPPARPKKTSMPKKAGKAPAEPKGRGKKK